VIQRPGQQGVSVPGARCAARLPGTAHGPFTVAGAGIACLVRRHLALSGVMLAGPARLATGSMACHEAINDGEGLVHQWRVTQLTGAGIPGPLAQAQADRAAGIRPPGWPGAAVPRHWPWR
jgi:hypothetical protein